MSKVKIVRIVRGSKESDKDSIEVLPGVYDSHRHATDAIDRDGDYIFLEVHSLKAAKKPGKPTKKEEVSNEQKDDKDKE